jgi:hypothetical protein
MAINPPLIPGDEDFNHLADRLAATLSVAFGYSLQEAELHIRNYFVEYERREIPGWSAADHFFHDGVAVVLLIGYTLAGGDPTSLAFLEWRKSCWDALRHGRRVPSPPIGS